MREGHRHLIHARGVLLDTSADDALLVHLEPIRQTRRREHPAARRRSHHLDDELDLVAFLFTCGPGLTIVNGTGGAVIEKLLVPVLPVWFASPA